MVWETLTRSRGTAIRAGEYTTSNMSVIHMPIGLRKTPVTWQIDRKNIIAKVFADSKGMYKSTEIVSVPSAVKKLINENKCVIYCTRDEDALYLGSYKEGSEKLALLIKKEGAN
jgi:hypothetical protein